MPAEELDWVAKIYYFGHRRQQVALPVSPVSTQQVAQSISLSNVLAPPVLYVAAGWSSGPTAPQPFLLSFQHNRVGFIVPVNYGLSHRSWNWGPNVTARHDSKTISIYLSSKSDKTH